MYLSPAEYVIRLFNGPSATGRAIGRDKSSISKWRWPKERGGSGGLIPSSAQRAVIEKARHRGLDLTSDDVIFGREVEHGEG